MFENPEFDALAIGAHPDDVEIACGGTLAKLARLGYRVAALSVTAAELSSRGDARIRAEEFAAAAAILQLADHKILDIPDGQIATTPENKRKLVREIRHYRPRVLFVHHWVARHPDHQHTSELVQAAVFQAGLAKIDTGQAPWRPHKVIYFPNRFDFEPSFVVDISETFAVKMQAVQAYHSQFHASDMKAYGAVQTAISHPAFLEHIASRAHRYGLHIGARHGEPFLVRENLAVEDPVALFSERCWYAVP